MIGITLWRYLFRRYVVMTFWFILGVLAIIYMVDFTEFSSRASRLPGYTIGLGAFLSLLRLPNIMQETVPFIILFSSMSVLLVLNRKYELVVARSAGISAWQFLMPLCAASFLMGVVMATMVNPFSSYALSKVQELELGLGIKRGTVGTIERPPWLRQRTEEGITIIGADKVARRGLLLGGATFVRFDNDGSITERLDAEQASLEPGRWILSDVTRFGDDGLPADVDEIVIKTNLRPEFVEESLASPQSISFFELPRKIEVARSFGLGANAFAMQYQSLLALPLLLVAMTLIAATVSLKFIRFGQSGTVILAGILAGFLLYVVTVLAKSFGTAGAVPPFVAAWLPAIVASAMGVTVLLHKEDG
ncbi:LPS export ABC transporter permease LptG [Hoeflea prorocentri]|uniref:LPS export ABC transporter permease LptG n=1 Tax=Hoeflea prorocentri TaxID=1922333 RepID=A0A9X3ULH5_9HYPH|nr:LPS export ABC transporter permease LptG [Hoeflea prorocentri]MCY6381394.1 LPS export ABC transporter permease LptG [Hoeflea prorocentri]MDA5399194.1 LPS export ABC transporter permease LptG [Hoeflea prorocentri]